MKILSYFFILFFSLTQSLHAEKFAYNLYGLKTKFMEITFSIGKKNKIKVISRSTGLLDKFVKVQGEGSYIEDGNKKIYTFQYKKKKKGRKSIIIFNNKRVVKNIAKPPRSKKKYYLYFRRRFV